MRWSVIDIGSNSVKLLVADVPACGKVEKIRHEAVITRLSEGLVKRGVLVREPMERTLKVVKTFAAEARDLGVQGLNILGMESLRVAKNAAEFARMVKEATGESLEILSGEEEARLGFAGVSLEFSGGASPLLMVDIGGASTEVVLALEGSLAVRSIPLGAVGMTEMYLFSDPPGEREKNALLQALREILRSCVDELARTAHPDRLSSANLVGVGGTIVTLAAMMQRLRQYDPRLIHRYSFTLQDIARIVGQLFLMTIQQRKQLPGLPPGRADVIAAGACILQVLMEESGIDSCMVSESNLLQGKVMEEVKRRRAAEIHVQEKTGEGKNY